MSPSAFRRPAIALIALSAVVGGFSLVLAQPGGNPPPAGQPGGGQPGGPGGGQPGERGPGRGPGGGAGGEIRNVNGAMRTLNNGVRALKTNIDKADKKAENLTTLESMQKAVVAAKGMDPGDLKGEDKDKDKVLAGYRKEQIKLLTALLELETAVIDGKTDAAKAMVDKLVEIRDEGHKEYKADKPLRGPGGRGGPGGGGGGGGGGNGGGGQ